MDYEKCNISKTKIAISNCLYSPRIYRATKRFIPSVHAVCLPQSEMIKEPNHIYAGPKIKETLRFHKLVRRRNQKGEYNISFFKVLNVGEPFRVQWHGDDNQLICGHEEAENRDNDCSKYNRVYKGEEEWLRCPACSQWFHEACIYE